MRVSIVGTGYVGLVTGACLAEKGHRVRCVDLDEGKVERINRGQPTIREVGLDGLLQRHAGTRLTATTDLKAAVLESDLTLIAVGTPFAGEAIDLTQVKEAARAIGAALKDKGSWHTVVVKSTVVPGTTDDVVLPILERESGKRAGRDFGVGMNPEFLTEGEAVGDFMEPDRLVLGASHPRALHALEELYEGFPGVPVVRTNPKTAEMIKYASNTLLATLISWSNELANLGSALGGIDSMVVVEALRSSRYLAAAPASPEIHWAGVPSEAHAFSHAHASAGHASNGAVRNPLREARSFRDGGDGASEPSPDYTPVPMEAPAPSAVPIASFLVPGCGFGGSCLPKDTAALAAHGRAAGVPMRILEAVNEVNRSQPARVLALLEKRLPDLKGVRVAVLGLAFRPGTGDLRESPAIPILRDLLARGAQVAAFDPAVAEEIAEMEAAPAGSQERSRGPHLAATLFDQPITLCPTLEDAILGAEAVVIVTRWPEFRAVPDLLEGRVPQPVVVDARRMLDKDSVARYEGIGL